MPRPVIILGTFDGVHRGHEKIVKAALSLARSKKLPCWAVTFHPHPQQYIVPERGLKLLTTLEERKERLKKLGVDKVVVIKFDQRLHNLSYEEFVRKIIVKRLKASYVVVGYDFAFGWGRLGHAEQLKHLGQQQGFEVKIIPAFAVGTEIVKSKKLRELLSAGNLNQVVQMLGHPYQLSGKVVKGRGVGRKLGFPTANLKVDPHKLIPAHGVYAATSTVLGINYKVAVNIGDRPTFGGVPSTLVEAHLLHFTGSLKGKRLKLEIYKRLRNEIQFCDTEDLKRQIQRDINVIGRLPI